MTPNDSHKDEQRKSIDKDKATNSSSLEHENEIANGYKGLCCLCISPTPSREDISEGEFDKIIKSTRDLLKFCQVKVDEQKISNYTRDFLLLRIESDMDDYCKYISKLNTFLVEADKVTAGLYSRMCYALPKYGDYVNAIFTEERDENDLGGIKVSRYKLEQLVKSVRDDYNAAAMTLRSGRAMYRDVNGTMSDRCHSVCKIKQMIPCWIEIQNSVICQLDYIRKQSFLLSTYLKFLEQRELKSGLKLDQEELAKFINSSVSPKRVAKQQEKREQMPSKNDQKQPETPAAKSSKKEVKEPEKTAETLKEIEHQTNINYAEDEKETTEDQRGSVDSDDIFDPKGRVRKYNKLN